jgi:hypothetical protein
MSSELRRAVQFDSMKRSRRRLVNWLAALSLVLCLATVGLWVLSYSIPTQVDARKLVDPQHHSLSAEEARFYGFDSVRGILGVSYTNLKGEILPFMGWKFDISHPHSGTIYHDPASTIFTRLGFHAWGQNWGGGSFQTYAITFHCWCLLVFFAVMSWGLIRHARRLAHHDPAFCTSCGYDLRATPERCPECGTIPPKRQIASG